MAKESRATLLDFALRRAGIPILGVSSTGRVDFHPLATPAHRSDAQALVDSFDPDDVTLQRAYRSAQAPTDLTRGIQAFYLFWFRKTYGHDPTPVEAQADRELLIAACRDVP
jgi:hypothetical protein